MTKSSSTTMVYYTRSSPFAGWSGPNTYVLSTYFDEMASSNHYPLNTDIDDGGVWILHKEIYNPIIGYVGPNLGTFYGQFTMSEPTAWVPSPITEISKSEMHGRGTTAIARSAPTNPLVNLASSGAEMLGSEVVPAIPGYHTWQNRAHLAKSAGNEYLNVEFGWLPLVSDITKAMYSMKHHNALIKQYQAGSDLKTRVGYGFPAQKSTRTEFFGNFLPVPLSAPYFGSGTLSEQTIEETWFKGCFKYHVPMGSGVADKLQRYEQQANYLLGTRLTPEVLWNATPWSWFGDWFGTTGDVLHNISVLGHDGLVLQYGYIMNHRERNHTAVVSAAGGQACGFYKSTIWKKRLPATPYGFGVDLATLTSSQISILAALGLSKGVPGFSH